MSLTFISDEERAWVNLTSSKSRKCCVSWNTKTGEVMVSRPMGGKHICEERARDAGVAMGIGETMLSSLGHKVQSGEFNAKIPIVNLG
jgi:hypothetical protein